MKNDKLSPGDLAIIIHSAQNKSIGKIVECVEIVGVHPELGTLWLVKSNSPISVVGGDSLRQATCAESWLKKLNPDDLIDDVEEQKELELT